MPPTLGRASEPGLRPGGYPPPAFGPPRRPGPRRCQPGSPRSKARAFEQPGIGNARRRTAMPAAMRRTTFWLRKEITVYEYERGLLYREGRLGPVLEPGRYTFWAWEPVDVVKVSLRELSHVVAGQGILTA